MPVLSCFSSFGFLEFSSAPSECEKVYRSLLASYRHPRTGQPTIDTTIGTHQEAKIFGWANAIAAAMVTLKRAANELRPETSYELLESHEERFGMTPGANDSAPDRRAALAAKQKSARGPRYEAVMEALEAILGDDLVAYRPLTTTEAEAYPSSIDPDVNPGIFRRPDAVAKSVRILTAIARGPAALAADSFDPGVGLSTYSLPGSGGEDSYAQSFTGDGNELLYAQFYLSPFGSPLGNITAKIYAHSGTFGTSSVPTGAALATSDPVDASTLTSGANWVTFAFSGANQITLTEGTRYVLTVEYPTGVAPDTVDVWGMGAGSTHAGNAAGGLAGVWTALSPSTDFAFRVYTLQTMPMEVEYENWNTHGTDQIVVAGDELCVDPGNWGLVERVTVISSEGTGEGRTFTAKFSKPHSAGTYATDGPVPLWSNTKRHVFVVVSATAAVDAEVVSQIDALFKRIMRGPTTWAIVRETSPGSGIIGPFAIGATSGSPLGTVPLESITL